MSQLNNIENNEVVVNVEGIDFDFGGPKILENINLKIQKGSRTLLVGPNGAGKSTLLRVIAGKHLIKGPAHVFGKRAFEDCPQGVTYLGTEWVANKSTRLGISVKELIKACGGDKYPERSEALIKLLDVDENWIMNQVSDGERRRVQIVLGLFIPWRLLLLDEVTTDLDVLVRSKLFRYLYNETIEREATIIYATHIFDGLGDWPTQIAHIRSGTIYEIHNIAPKSNETNTLTQRLANFPRLLEAIENSKNQLEEGKIIDSPLLQVIEGWLAKDFEERIERGDTRGHTKWDELSENMKVYGDRFYNYWK